MVHRQLELTFRAPKKAITYWKVIPLPFLATLALTLEKAMVFKLPKFVLALSSRQILCLAAICTVCGGLPNLGLAQDRNDENKRIALSKKPKFSNVQYDTPPAEDYEKCTVEPSAEFFAGRGFVVKNPAGQIVRMYVKENSGATHWTFFRNGNEVYREIDSNADRRVDQYRWMGEAGTRWGVDNDQNGQLDSWKVISAEEVAFEAVEAFRTNDRARFARLCLANEDLANLQLGRKLQTQVAESVTGTLKGVATVMKSTRMKESSKFVDFSGARPSVVPAGKFGLGKDLTIYDNVSALYSDGGQIKNLALGTLVKVGERWRLVELPEMMSEDATVQNGRMFVMRAEEIVETRLNKELQGLIGEYNKVNAALKAERQPANKARLYQQRTEMILKVAAASETAEDKKLWLRMAATEASIGYQIDEYPNGIKVLEQLANAKAAATEKAFVTWELIQAKARDTRKGGSDQMREANQQYMEMLQGYVSDFPKAESSPQALLQLAMFEEFSNSGDSEENAIRWYTQAATSFPESREGRFAAGAKRRLTCYGEALNLSGTTLTNQRLDTASYRGTRNVVIHYWCTQDQLSLDDFKRLVALKAKHKDLAIVGVNLDENPTLAKNFLRQKQPNANWPHLWAEGGKLNSNLALQMGVTTVPLTMLINKQGEVVENQAITDDLDRQIQRLRNRRK
jgi:hypothetical protein